MFAQIEVQILSTNHSYHKKVITAEDKDRLKIRRFWKMTFQVNAEKCGKVEQELRVNFP